MEFDDIDNLHKKSKILHADLCYSIVGSAFKVLNTLKPGLNEKAYENALVIELTKRGHHIQQQRKFDVFYEGIKIDTLIPDLLLDDLVIVDPKVVTNFNETHVAQMMGYLAITGFDLAILLNFKNATLEDKRVIR